MHDVCVFLDLDDTLFQSASKMKQQWGLDFEFSGSTVAAHDPSGTPNGFMLPHQQTLLSWLDDSARWIPTTFRTREQFERTTLSGFHAAILCGGGLILNEDGQVDPTWANRMHTKLEPHQPELRRLTKIAERLRDTLPLLVRAERLGPQIAFVQIKLPAESWDRADWLIGTLTPELNATSESSAIELVQHQRTAYLMPRCLQKREAVEYWLDTQPASPFRLTIGIGDAHQDRGFLDACHFAAMPQKSRLWQGLIHRDGR